MHSVPAHWTRVHPVRLEAELNPVILKSGLAPRLSCRVAHRYITWAQVADVRSKEASIPSRERGCDVFSGLLASEGWIVAAT